MGGFYLVNMPILPGLSLIFPGEYPMLDAEIPTLRDKNGSDPNSTPLYPSFLLLKPCQTPSKSPPHHEGDPDSFWIDLPRRPGDFCRNSPTKMMAPLSTSINDGFDWNYHGISGILNPFTLSTQTYTGGVLCWENHEQMLDFEARHVWWTEDMIDILQSPFNLKFPR